MGNTTDPPVITFSRRKKSPQEPPVKTTLAPAPARSLPTPEQQQHGKVALLTPGDTPESTISARWRRRRAPMNATQKAEADQQAYLAELRAHFAEVDALELAVETPTPPGKVVMRQSGGGWAVDRSRPMSLGLSSRFGVPAQRLSMLPSKMVSPSPLRISLGPQATLRKQADIPVFMLGGENAIEDAGGDGDATAVGPTPRRSSVASMLGRLSLRESDALEHSASKGTSEDVVTAEQRQGELAEPRQSRAPAAGVSPIKEEDEEEETKEEEKVDTAKRVPPPSQRPSLEDASASGAAEFSTLSPLDQLLRLCGQEAELSSLPSMEGLLGQHVDLAMVKKIGEGTFGEAFKAGNLVLKIVPMEGALLVNGEPQKRAEEILAEVAITLTLSGLRSPALDGKENGVNTCANSTAGFVETHGVGICRGCYAPALREEWHRWDEQHGSENESVDIFNDDQLFVVFVVADGGLDLEHFEPQSFAELRSILMQVTMTLAVAEEACQFEHRDLHWGNLLISRDGTETVPFRLRDVDVTVEAAGVRVTLIDFTLSRLVTPEGEVAFCDLAADPELFRGPKGDAQAETYRRMQRATRDDWQQYMPVTNALWLRYLADIILAYKMPAAGCSSDDRHLLRNFRKAAAGACAAADLVWDDMFSGHWQS